MITTQTARRKVTMILPDDLLLQLISAMADMDIRQGALNTLLGSGSDLNTEAAVGYIKSATEDAIAATKQYGVCVQQVVALAKEKAQYDAGKCSPVRVEAAGTTGAVSWTVVEKPEEE